MGKRDSSKLGHVLGIYDRLMNGYTISKQEEADRYGVSLKTIQRYINDIRMHLADEPGNRSVVYDRDTNRYRMEHIDEMRFTNSEILAVCKILLDSRGLLKDEMETILNKLLNCCVPKINRQLVNDMICNEKFHYIEPQHKTPFLKRMWKLARAIHEKRCIEITYKRLKGQETVVRRLIPVAILFSEYYFYLTAFIDNEKNRERLNGDVRDFNPTIYRIDRIKTLNVLEERCIIPYTNRFEEGEFRKRVQFMFGGELQKVQFEYSGMSIEAVLDRLPTAKVLKNEKGVYVVEAEVYGKGIEMWLRSQGDAVKVTKL